MSDSDIPRTQCSADVAWLELKIELPCSTPVSAISEEGIKDGTRYFHLAQNPLWWANPHFMRPQTTQRCRGYTFKNMRRSRRVVFIPINRKPDCRGTGAPFRQLWFSLTELNRLLWQDVLSMTGFTIYYLPLLLYCSLSAEFSNQDTVS